MSANRNKVILIGNLGADPEIRITPNGKRVANFNMATDDNYTNSQGEAVKEVQWHHVVAWGKLAEKVEAELKKGCRVRVEGRIGYRSYEDKEGQKRYLTEITIGEFELQQTAVSVDLPQEHET
ncbi:single-stranded DNA-binding protein [Flavihumibacter petaseus]|uniref:Single-stranded DNA-binding protein n=1 Tax=Flavihumibacter petaseus NBRC 106054 TaxID=1220578 RepID=A0A0E9MZ46_9BACT|nr:single-stranded DNA-binding protein [Flavihumibacter petaseus]GAO42365.1 single-stranded DNA-binding protein [Flavihumibacter petaseus NBRC 106054]